MSLRRDIEAFLVDVTGIRQERFNLDDIFTGNGIAGDDGDELIMEFSKRFNVNLAGFISYFHYVAEEPPSHRRVLPIGDDDQIISFIPVNIEMLVRSAQRGRWDLEYPSHSIRLSLRSRVIRVALVAIPVALLIGFCWIALWGRN